jgi:hypothetical protein
MTMAKRMHVVVPPNRMCHDNIAPPNQMRTEDPLEARKKED